MLSNKNGNSKRIIESEDMEPIKHYSLSAAARDCGVSKQMIVYAYRNRKTRIVRRKGGLSGWLRPARWWINLAPRLN